MNEVKITKLSIRDDRPTAVASSAYGSNVNAIGFNIMYLAERNPKLAVEVLRLLELAHQVKEDERAPDEDYALFADQVKKISGLKADV